MIPVIIAHGDMATGYQVLVDSGSDTCVFDTGIADVLGIDWKNGKPKEIFGVGGKAHISYVCPVTLDVSGASYEVEACFLPNTSGRAFKYGLVGQQGFFDRFVVKFDFSKEELELKAVR